MADSCVQHLHYRFEDASAGGEANTATRFTVLADIEWVKPCLFKGRVESETWSGMKKYYEIVELEIQDLHAQSFRPVLCGAYLSTRPIYRLGGGWSSKLFSDPAYLSTRWENFFQTN